MRELLESTEFILALVLGCHIAGRWVYKKTQIMVFHPIVISIALLITLLKITKIEYATFMRGSEFIHFMLGPVVVSLGYLLYDKIEYLKANAKSILTSTFVGCVVGVFSVIFLGLITGASTELIYSLEPKSVTIPIAIDISELANGIVPLTIAAVVLAGLFGSVVGPSVLRLMGIKSSIAKGLALGSASHGIGTGEAMEMGEMEGAFAGLAMGVMGVMTALFIPTLHLVVDFIVK